MKATPRITVAMLGGRRHYAVPRILAQEEWLELFYTDLYAGWSCMNSIRESEQYARNEQIKKLAERYAVDIPKSQVRQFPLFGLSRKLRSRWARTPSQRLRSYAAWNSRFGNLVSKRGLGEANGLYAFNAAGLEVFQSPEARSLIKILDQTTAPWQIEEGLLAEERHRWPNWEADAVTPADWEPLAERERDEWQLADLIVCGSDFVADGVRKAGGPTERCAVVPYGINVDDYPTSTRNDNAPLRILFVGTLQLRKGIQYLLQAATKIPSSTATFRAVGPVRVSSEAMNELSYRVEIVGPVSAESLSREYADADVLVLPTLSEGSANVCYEALASGLPVITTPNSGSVVEDGKSGYVVPIQDPDAIVERLMLLAEDRDKLAALASQARDRAVEYSSHAYARRLTGAISALYESRDENHNT